MEKVPIFVELYNEELKCPFCGTVIVPVDAAVDVLGECSHLVLQHLWGYEADTQHPLVEEWWETQDTERNKLHEECEFEETLYRKCPVIDQLVEHEMTGGGPEPTFRASFGFCKSLTFTNKPHIL